MNKYGNGTYKSGSTEELSRRDLGGKGEDAVCAYIEKYGYRVIARNFICPKGEIDIIAENSDTVAFIEVKSRKENSMVSGIDSVGNTKKKRIIRTAAWYSYRYPLEKQPRFDIAEVILKNDICFRYPYLQNVYDCKITSFF